MNKNLIDEITTKYQFSEKQVKSVLNLLEDNNTVPFIARYRKEATGGLDEVQIKQISDEYQYVANLQKRKEEVIHNIEQQGLLTNELREDILKQTKLQRVEDLYRPFKQKKKTRATEAKRKGLESLAKWIYDGQQGDLKQKAESFITDEVTNIDEAIQGALDIIAEHVSDNPKYRSRILKDLYRQGSIVTTKKKKAEDEKEIFAMYYDYVEPIRHVANHRVLAMNRGEKEKILSIKIEFDTKQVASTIEKSEIKLQNSHRDYIKLAIEDSLKRLIMPSIEREIRADLTSKAEQHAIEVFSENLKHLLLQPPMKGKQILGVDPAFRTGCKLAVINPFGTFIDKSVIYPHPPKSKIEASEKEIVRMI
ncbi:Tex-like N-terminal domain-containing protein, partial [Staphylococcus borealis]